ncbi:MAG: sugar ABC transporter permease [Chloroflexi bacterium]|nr:sugar ABC transporter permease [Chloroflexota bacterium]
MLYPVGFMLPGLFLFAIFMVYPFGKLLQISLYQWRVVAGEPSRFIGLSNYAKAVQDPVFWVAMRNSILYTAVTVPGIVSLGLLTALFMNHIKYARAFFRTVYYLPVVTSWVASSLLFKYLFQWPSGFINYVLVDVLRVVTEPIPWLLNPMTAMVPITALGIWKGIGWAMVIFLAAIQAIPNEIYESAVIDGAGRWVSFWNITLPLIRPALLFVLVILVIAGFNVFVPVYLITGGGPMKQTEVLQSYMYHQAFDFLDFGYGAAISCILAVAVLLLTAIQIRTLRRPARFY